MVLRTTLFALLCILGGVINCSAQGGPDNTIHYVANTRPPDAYLSLRTHPASSYGQRIMTMPNGTLLRVLQRRNDGWWYVRALASGNEGWTLSAQGDKAWIECCVTAALPPQATIQLYSPQLGVAERSAIMDAIRLATNWTIKFKVSHLLVARQGNKAIAVADVSDAAAKFDNSGIFLLENLNSQWRARYSIGGGGGASDCKVEANISRKMTEKAQEYSAPNTLFPDSFWMIIRENKSEDDCMGTISEQY